MCRVGFNNAQWMPGTQTDANQCQGIYINFKVLPITGI